MYTNRRLTQAYHNAKLQSFDSNSKYVIFSDCHRGDDSISDEFARNQVLMFSALEYYYKNGFTYVEAGDGDDLWKHSDFRYIRSAHVDIFSILKEFFADNRFIMLYGNHNIYMRDKWFTTHNYYNYYDEYQEKKEKLFYGLKPIESLLLKEKNTGQEILVVHGHQGDLLNDQLWFISMISVRYFWKFMHLVGFRNPASPARNQFKRHKIEKNYCKWIKKNGIMLICGHTHRMRFPMRRELPYFNSGCCVHTKGISAIEIEDDKISLVQWRIMPNSKGTLKVIKKVLFGPEPIETWRKEDL